ncbi:MAG: hypothetical protein AAGC88_03140 [Bacteroidota bacterium]
MKLSADSVNHRYVFRDMRRSAKFDLLLGKVALRRDNARQLPRESAARQSRWEDCTGIYIGIAQARTILQCPTSRPHHTMFEAKLHVIDSSCLS